MGTPKKFQVMTLCRRRLQAAFALVIPAVLFSLPTAWPQSRITGPIDDSNINDSNLVTLRGNAHPLTQAKFDRGAVPADFPVEHMILVLRRSALVPVGRTEVLRII